MKIVLLPLSAVTILLSPSCSKREKGASDYEVGKQSGAAEVNSNHQKEGWWGEVKMDVKDELNYVPHDSQSSAEFNAGKVDGYLQRRNEVDSAQRKLESERLNSAWDGFWGRKQHAP